MVKPTVAESATTVVPINSSQSQRPTFSPITAFQEWINQNNNDQPNYDQGVSDQTTGQQGEGNTPSTGGSDWFDPNEWDNGQNATNNDEDKSILDHISDKVFGDDERSEAMIQGASFLLHMLAVGAWTAIA